MSAGEKNKVVLPRLPFIPAGQYLYFGDPNTDGSWRIYISGANLVIEKREASSWVEKGSYLP